MTEYKKKLIEVALPLEAINAACAREKSIRHGHPSTLHLWWARRPLAACRAVLFASLVDDPSAHPDAFPTEEAQEVERKRLFRIIEDLVKWENSTDETVLAAARAEIVRSTDGNLPPLLDPFCGGGSIPLEAQRLGLEAHASDLNPVAVLITKALVEIPPKFAGLPPVNPEAHGKLGDAGWRGAQGLADDVRYYGRWMRDRAERRIGHLYPKEPLPSEEGGGEAIVCAWLWARTVKCPNPACGAEMPLMRSYALSTVKGRHTWLEPVVDSAAKVVRFKVTTGEAVRKDGTKLRGKGRGFLCLVCGEVANLEYVHDEMDAARGGMRLLAEVVEGNGHRLYVDASPSQLAANVEASQIAATLVSEERAPSEPARGTFGGNALGRRYGFRTFADYFTGRQLVALVTLSDLIAEAREQVLHDAEEASPDLHTRDADSASAKAYADAVATYLAFALSKLIDRCCSLVTWFPQRDSFYHAFARQAVPMTWDFAEGAPLLETAGSYVNAVNWTAETIDGLRGVVPAFVSQLDAISASGVGGAAVSTDPPYYDNIGYADLSDFFYVWLRRSLRDIYPDLFSTLLTPKAQELIATPYRFEGSKKRAQAFFEDGPGSGLRANEGGRQSGPPAHRVLRLQAGGEQGRGFCGQYRLDWLGDDAFRLAEGGLRYYRNLANAKRAEQTD